jgi:hypothetical protein
VTFDRENASQTSSISSLTIAAGAQGDPRIGRDGDAGFVCEFRRSDKEFNNRYRGSVDYQSEFGGHFNLPCILAE